MKLPGWTKLSPVVYKHTSGVWVHTLGLVVTPDGEHWADCWPNQLSVNHHARIQGSRRRGLLAWGLSLLKGEPE